MIFCNQRYCFLVNKLQSLDHRNSSISPLCTWPDELSAGAGESSNAECGRGEGTARPGLGWSKENAEEEEENVWSFGDRGAGSKSASGVHGGRIGSGSALIGGRGVSPELKGLHAERTVAELEEFLWGFG